MMSLVWLFSHQQPSTFAYARQIIKKEGLGFQGLNKGFTATLGRHGIFNMVYFGFYHNVKNIIPASKKLRLMEINSKAEPEPKSG
ncbi:hypothetical protein U0070_004082 [Myodes glareolus]|uniref:Mitochondrial 2-oxodicarboxylate carrier n=1 Tax=Myodes glareolus TaxID=447135 RepID=A0AAW0KBS1_MYOGA